MRITIIVPCYNEEDVVEETVRRLANVADQVPWQSEFLFIDDGSRDKTLPLLERLHLADQRISIVSFTRNFGHQAAVSAGLHFAKGDAAVIIDADLQDPPEIIPDMVEKWKESDARIVFGRRRKRKGESLLKTGTARAFYRVLNRLSEIPLPLNTGDFRLLDRMVIDAFNALPERNKYIRGLFPWLGYKAVPLEYDRDARYSGTTKYPLGKMLKLAGDGMFSFSRKPLRIATFIGIVNIVVSLALVVYVFVAYFSKSIMTVPGWASTLLVIVFFSGIQLVSMGLLGAYIGRIFDEVKGRPEYVVEAYLEAGDRDTIDKTP